MTSSSAAPPLLPLVENPDDPLVREQFDKLAAGNGILNLHRMMAHAPALLKASGDMALAFRRNTALPRPTAELAILRAASTPCFSSQAMTTLGGMEVKIGYLPTKKCQPVSLLSIILPTFSMTSSGYDVAKFATRPFA